MLNKDQKAKVFQINLERANGHVKAFKNGRKREVIQHAAAKWKTDLKQVLTAEQTQKLKI